MIFDKLANGIMKHSKLIIAVWVVALICSAPFITKAMDKLKYDMGEMADDDSESLEGFKIMKQYFHDEGTDPINLDLLVITFDDSAGKTAAMNLAGKLYAEFPNYKEGDKSKLSAVVPYDMYEKGESGMQLVAIIYDQEFMSKASDDTGKLREWIAGLVAESGGAEIKTYLTGTPAMLHDMMKTAAHDVSQIDIFSIALILILVGLFFRSIFAAAMPPVTIGVAIGIVFCSLFFVAEFMDIFFITEMFILVSMLGAGCDYCIFIIARYREERRKGADHPAAMRSSIVWAGESIATSGIAVMIGFGAMSICSFSMISGMGVMLAIGIGIALLAALTLITSILNILGERMFWPSKISSFQEGGKAMKGWYGKCARLGDSYFHKSVKFSIKNAKAIVVAAVLVTVPAAYVLMTSQTSYDMMGTMMTGDSKAGLYSVEKYTDGGIMMPTYDVVEFEDTIATYSEMPLGTGKLPMLTWTVNENYGKILQLCQKVEDSDDNIGSAFAVVKWIDLAMMTKAKIGDKTSSETDLQYLLRMYSDPVNGLLASHDVPASMKGVLGSLYSKTVELGSSMPLAYDNPVYNGFADAVLNYKTGNLGGVTTGGITELNYVKVTIITKEQSMSDRSIQSLHNAKKAINDFRDESGSGMKKTYLTGTPAVMYEISEQVNKEFMKVILLAIVLIFLLLFVVMKSYLTPLRSILTILMSVVWTVAITHVLFTNVMGYGVIWMVPIILIVICLGLGMDYDILLTTRIKENHLHRGMSNDEAITEAVVSSGSVITICGLIMGGAFGTLMLSSTILLKEFGFALCFAILVDALIVRTYIVPALMHLMDEWCWKGPKFMHRNLRKACDKK